MSKETKKEIASAVLRGVDRLARSNPQYRNVRSFVGKAKQEYDKIATIVGSGDYDVVTNRDRIKTNSLFRQGDAKDFVTFGDGSIRIKKREYIGEMTTDLTTPGAFKSVAYHVQPANVALFPYISNLAMNFERFKFLGLAMEFVSSVSPVAASSLGTIMMTSYENPTSAGPTSKAIMENTEGCLSTRTDRCMMYGKECASPSQNYYFVPHGDQTSYSEYQSHQGMMVVACSGGNLPVNTTIGDLWVTYDVVLSGPRMPDIRPGYYRWNAGCSAANVLGVSGNYDRYGTLSNMYVENISSIGYLRFSNVTTDDEYLISIRYDWTAAGTALVYPVIGYVGLTPLIIMDNGSTAVTYSPNESLATTTSAFIQYAVKLTDKNAYVSFSSLTISTASPRCEIFVSPIGYGLASKLLGPNS